MDDAAPQELQEGQYMGQVPCSTNVQGIILATSHHERDVAIPAHYHVNPHFTYVLAGCYEEAFGRERINCQRGDLLYHPAGFEHSNQFLHGSAACFNVEISPDCLLPGGGLRAMQQQRVLTAPKFKHLLHTIIREVEQPDCFSESIIVGASLHLTGLFMRGQNPRTGERRAVRRVQELLQDVPAQTPSLLEMSQTAGLSPFHLCREFKRATGLTPGQYARQQKVAHACALLASPDLTMEEVAFRVGFTDASYLTRVFKKMVGTTPGAYRKMIL